MESQVERYFIKSLHQAPVNAGEHIPVIVVENFVALGELAALRFLEWSCIHPEGVIALPTGKTPEFFIKWTRFYRDNWTQEYAHGKLGRLGVFPPKPPDLRGLSFVQLDEFFPINPLHERSFHHFVNRFYLQEFGLDKNRAMLMDTYAIRPKWKTRLKGFHNLERLFPDDRINLELRTRHPVSKLEEAQKEAISMMDEFCEEYEGKIRELGGIGFFLGGIGPDGHIAFNVSGSSHHSHTRLAPINYETMAVAASDLGGMKSVRKKAVITIGLETITFNRDCTAIVMAAGEVKSRVVARAVEEEACLENPASSLHKLANARFFLTRGAACQLRERNRQELLKSRRGYSPEIERLMIDGRMQLAKKGAATEPSQVPMDWKIASQITGKSHAQLSKVLRESLVKKIRRGLNLPVKKTILHTAPHHDDIELAYFPYIHHLVRSPNNDNYFCYCTSGFTSVTDEWLSQRLKNLKEIIKAKKSAWFEKPNLPVPKARQTEVEGYLNGIARQDSEMQSLHLSSRLLRLIREHLPGSSQTAIINYIDKQQKALKAKSAGEKDTDSLQLLKGWLREWEAELAWAHFGISLDKVLHLRLKFYTGAMFLEDPGKRDVQPLFHKLEQIQPDIITVAMDPEASGPDTHFKTLIAIARALELYKSRHPAKRLRIWAYRNVWTRFHLAEATTIIPVSLNSFAVLHNMFNTCFSSQKTASFPSYELDGTFSELAQKIWVEQFNDVIQITGREFFFKSKVPMLRRAFGAIYLKDMSYAEFTKQTRSIKQMLQSKKNLKALG